MEFGETNVTGVRLAELERAARLGFPPNRQYLDGYDRMSPYAGTGHQRIDPALYAALSGLAEDGLELGRGPSLLLNAPSLVALGPEGHRDLVRALRHGVLARVVRNRRGVERIEALACVRKWLDRQWATAAESAGGAMAVGRAPTEMRSPRIDPA